MREISEQLERNDMTEERKASDNEIKISSSCSHLKLATRKKENLVDFEAFSHVKSSVKAFFRLKMNFCFRFI